jgi:hypothetical protein
MPWPPSSAPWSATCSCSLGATLPPSGMPPNGTASAPSGTNCWSQRRLSRRSASTGMLESWRLGNPEERRQLLGVFFDALHVKDGQIVAQTPREDRVTEVVELIAARDGRS